MIERPSPFALVFGEIAPQRFPELARAIGADAAAATDRGRFVLLGPVGQLLRDLAPDDAPPDAMDAYVRMLHHAYRHWVAGAWVFDVSAAALERALAGTVLSSQLPHAALYLRLPALRVWGATRGTEPPEPLDGVFVTAGAIPGTLAALGIFGMHGERPGFSAVAVEGRADEQSASVDEVEIPTARADGSPAFAPQLTGGAEAAMHSVADAGEMLLLVCRLLPLLPAAPPRTAAPDNHVEQIVAVM